MGEMILQVNHLSKAFGSHEVLRDIDFTVEKGDVISIIGASGSGKSTLLRCINLLETPTSGSISFQGKSIATMKPHEYRSRVGMVFQSFNLFDNMTVLENCMVGQIKVLKKNKRDAKISAMRYLEKVGMAPYINARPRQLSGGQKQRVAIAGILAMEPSVIIADEATAHVDGGAGTYTIYTLGCLDTVGTLYDAGGNIIANNDDFNSQNFSITAQLEYGETYYICVKAYGENIAEKIHLRVMQIEAAESVEFMMSHNIGRCHKLKNNRKGEYAVDLAHPYRLVFEVKGEEIEIAKILEVVDYH